jgi:hypothetical protein
VRRLIDNHEQESLIIYTVHKPLDDAETLGCQQVIHSNGEYGDEDVTSTPARATARWCGRGYRLIKAIRKTS